jgi:hypothetical protein
MIEHKCPHDGSTLEDSGMLYIEVCPKCQYCYDVFHGKEVSYDWAFGVADPDDDGDHGFQMHPDWEWRE